MLHLVVTAAYAKYASGHEIRTRGFFELGAFYFAIGFERFYEFNKVDPSERTISPKGVIHNERSIDD